MKSEASKTLIFSTMQHDSFFGPTNKHDLSTFIRVSGYLFTWLICLPAAASTNSFQAEAVGISQADQPGDNLANKIVCKYSILAEYIYFSFLDDCDLKRHKPM